MTELVRPELSDADGAEVTDRLRDQGVEGPIRTSVQPDGMHILVADGQEATASAALDGWTPTAEPGQYTPPVPDVVRNAVLRLKARADAGDPVARDCLIVLFWLNKRLNNP